MQPFPKLTQPVHPKVEHAFIALKRIINALLAPLVGSLRCLIYIQQWRNPTINCALIATFVFLFFTASSLLLTFLPVYIGALVVLRGYILHVVSRSERVAVYNEDWCVQQQEVSSAAENMGGSALCCGGIAVEVYWSVNSYCAASSQSRIF